MYLNNESTDEIMDSGPSLDLDEMRTALAEMSLASITIGEYLVVMNADFDVVVHGEPYLAITLLFNLRSRRFLARIWNRTVRLGEADRLEQLVSACRIHFGQGRPCLGSLQDPEQQQALDDDEHMSCQTPVPRTMSKKCLGVLGKDAGSEVASCRECLGLGDASAMTEMCKVEIKSDAEEEEGVDDLYDMNGEGDDKLEMVVGDDAAAAAAVSAIEEMRGEPSMNILWDFLRHLLDDDRFANFIAWTDRERGVFKIVDSAGLANLWGVQKNHSAMNFDKMSRALRNYYKSKQLKKATGHHRYQ